MDARRTRAKRSDQADQAGQQRGTPPAPQGRADFATVLAKLDAVLAEQHALRRLVHRMTVPVDVLNVEAAAVRLGVSVRTLERLTARATFTDARSPERRVARVARVYYADELDVYRAEGRPGVERLRQELGRD